MVIWHQIPSKFARIPLEKITQKTPKSTLKSTQYPNTPILPWNTSLEYPAKSLECPPQHHQNTAKSPEYHPGIPKNS
jgi:hypothetical protein